LKCDLKIKAIENLFKIILIVIFFSAWAEFAFAQSFLFPGASTAFESGLSQTNTRGAAALASNPANALLTKRIESYADMTIVNFSYTYQMPDYAPAKIAMTAPPVNFGGTFKPKSNIAFGYFFTPRPGLDVLKIKNVPFDMDGTVLPVDLEQKGSTFLTALGAALKSINVLPLDCRFWSMPKTHKLWSDVRVQQVMRMHWLACAFAGFQRKFWRVYDMCQILKRSSEVV